MLISHTDIIICHTESTESTEIFILWPYTLFITFRCNIKFPWFPCDL